MFGFDMIVHGRENTRKRNCICMFILWCILDVDSKNKKKKNQNLRQLLLPVVILVQTANITVAMSAYNVKCIGFLVFLLSLAQ